MVTPDGVALAIYDQQPEDPANCRAEIIFLHGYSQSALCWSPIAVDPRFSDCRLIACDLRGHGASDKPDDEAMYRNAGRWADDLKSVLTATKAARPYICAWSYAGRMVLDYLEKYGDAEIAGLILVSATSTSEPTCYGESYSSLKRLHAEDVEENVDAVIGLWDVCTAEPIPEIITRQMIACNMLTPPYVRRHLAGRRADYDHVLRAVTVPTLLIHGEVDKINAVGMSLYTRDRITHSELHIYERTGHCPFLERPHRFAKDVSAFVDSVS